MFISLSSEFLHLRSVRWILADLYSFYQIRNFCILSQFYSHFIKRRIRAIKEIGNRMSARRLWIFDQKRNSINLCLSTHVLLIHVLLIHVLSTRDLSIHVLLTHDLSVHVLLIHILPTHDLSIHVLLIHDLSSHVLLIHVSLTLGRTRVVGVVVGCHPPLRIFWFFFP